MTVRVVPTLPVSRTLLAGVSSASRKIPHAAGKSCSECLPARSARHGNSRLRRKKPVRGRVNPHCITRIRAAFALAGEREHRETSRPDADHPAGTTHAHQPRIHGRRHVSRNLREREACAAEIDRHPVERESGRFGRNRCIDELQDFGGREGRFLGIRRAGRHCAVEGRRDRARSTGKCGASQGGREIAARPAGRIGEVHFEDSAPDPDSGTGIPTRRR